MKTFIAGHEARTVDDALELALGTPLALWLGVDDETNQERAARLDAARDILADDPELLDRVTALAATLVDITSVRRPARSVRTTNRRRVVASSGVAA